MHMTLIPFPGNYKMFKKNLLVISIWGYLGLLVCCQAADSNDLYTDLERLFSQFQSDSIITVEINDNRVKQADPNKLLDYLKPYSQSEDFSVKSLAFYYQVLIAKSNQTLKVKQEVVNNLVAGLVSKKESDRSSRRQYKEYLFEFAHESFSEKAKTSLLKALMEDHPSRELILVCGVAQHKEALPRLKELLIDEIDYQNDPNMKYASEWYYTLGWNARLARARIGEKEDIDKCMELIKKEKDSDNKFIVLLPQLGYIRQREALDYLKTYFFSDLRLEGGEIKTPLRNYLIPIFEENLSNFPLEIRIRGNYNKEEINIFSNWISKQKEWQIRR